MAKRIVAINKNQEAALHSNQLFQRRKDRSNTVFENALRMGGRLVRIRGRLHKKSCRKTASVRMESGLGAFNG